LIAVLAHTSASAAGRFEYAARALCERIGLVVTDVALPARGPVVHVVHGEPPRLPDGAFILSVPDTGLLAGGTIEGEPRFVVADDVSVPVWTTVPVSGEPLLVFDNGSPAATIEHDGETTVLRLGWDVLDETFFHLSRLEESATPRDEHDRVVPDATLLVRSRHADRPIVDQAAFAVRAAIAKAARLTQRPMAALDPWPDGAAWAVAFSHDVDLFGVWRTRHAGGEFLRGLRDMATGRVIGGSKRAGTAVIGWLTRHDPSDTFEKIRTIERDAGVASTFHVFGGGDDPHDRSYYARWRKTRARLRSLVEEGCEAALHGSYLSHTDAEMMRAEAEIVSRMSGKSVVGARQHYLRYDPSATPRAHADAGFQYDSTLGHASVPSFRAGTGLPFVPWDLDGDRLLSHHELPLVVMDTTRHLYGDGDVNAHVQNCLNIANSAKRVSSALTVLWHTEVFDDETFPGYTAAFTRIVSVLAGSDTWTPAQSELVSFRRARTCLRAVSISEEDDGWAVSLKADETISGLGVSALSGRVEGGLLNLSAGSIGRITVGVSV
jgi:hypothetical protein